jgi:hypothetical protein
VGEQEGRRVLQDARCRVAGQLDHPGRGGRAFRDVVGPGDRVAVRGQRRALDLRRSRPAGGRHRVLGQPDPICVGQGPGQCQRQPGPDRRPQAHLFRRQRPVGLPQQVGLLVVGGRHLETGHPAAEGERGVREVGGAALLDGRVRRPEQRVPGGGGVASKLEHLAVRDQDGDPVHRRLGERSDVVRRGGLEPEAGGRLARRADRPLGSALAGSVTRRAAPVVRESRGGRSRAIRQRRRDASVQPGALGAGHALHQHLADQRVPEVVVRGPRRVVVEQAGGHRLVQERSHRRVGAVRHRGEQVRLDPVLGALRGDRGRREEGGARLAEPGHAASQHLLDAGRNPQRTGWAVREQQPRDLVDEERVAARAGVQVAHVPLGQRSADDPGRQVGHRVHTDRRQRDPPHPGGEAGELVGDLRRGFQGIVAAGEQQHHREGGDRVHGGPQHGQRRRVAPVQVLDHHEERTPPCGLCEGVHHRRGENLTSRGSAVAVPPQPRRDLGERPLPRPQRGRAGRRTRPSGHLHTRGACLPGEPVAQHGLAHTGLAEKQRRPPVALPRGTQRRCELGAFGIASDHVRTQWCWGGHGHQHTTEALGWGARPAAGRTAQDGPGWTGRSSHTRSRRAMPSISIPGG